jgi:hypothetical protein
MLISFFHSQTHINRTIVHPEMRIFVQNQASGPYGLRPGGACEKNNHPGTIRRTCPGIFTGTYGTGRHLFNIPSIYSPPNFGELIF